MGGASSVASEATGMLKTWLSRPVSRTGVLLTKWTIAVLYALAGAALVAVVSLVAGVAAFGLHPLVTLSGTTIGAPQRAGPDRRRLPAGGRRRRRSLSIAFFISTLTDSSLTAATIAIAFFTVLTILNAFSVFDFVKPYTVLELSPGVREPVPRADLLAPDPSGAGGLRGDDGGPAAGGVGRLRAQGHLT